MTYKVLVDVCIFQDVITKRGEVRDVVDYLE